MDYRPGQVAEILGVSVDTARRWIDAGRLPSRRAPDGRRVVDGAELAAYLVERGRTDRGTSTESARNRLTGIVTRVVKDGVAAQVELQAGPFRLVSLMTREAAEELGLAPGMPATAVVKATNVVVEVER